MRDSPRQPGLGGAPGRGCLRCARAGSGHPPDHGVPPAAVEGQRQHSGRQHQRCDRGRVSPSRSRCRSVSLQGGHFVTWFPRGEWSGPCD